ncbi:hypothetical protein SLA2020_459040 [Shorea laevis]
MVMIGGDSWTQIGSSVAGLMFVLATLKQFFPYDLQLAFQEFVLATLQRFPFVQKLGEWLIIFFSPYVHISFPEYYGYQSNEAYTAIEAYLGALHTDKAAQLRGTLFKESKFLILSREDSRIWDEFKGVKLWWSSGHSTTPDGDSRYYQLTVHRCHRPLITGSYLDYVIEEGKTILTKNKQRKLFSNNPSSYWHDYRRNLWSKVTFENPATFQTLAMDPKKKEEIVDDLLKFSKGKEYYTKIGKAWKRGYLLYGPPGTGKSTMIAAMANLLNYDIYDLELTTIKTNTELRKLLVGTSNKSIIVIEDIDCSLDLTGHRNRKKGKGDNFKDDVDQKENELENEMSSKVTLSGLLNSIDGIWSACGQERIIVFTTNHVDKLDPALIRRGRMDMHIELSYCKFEAFKILAKNFLDLDSHHLFERIDILLKEVNMTPADVAEHLLPKSENKDVESCLKNLIQALEYAKKKARSKTVPKSPKHHSIYSYLCKR